MPLSKQLSTQAPEPAEDEAMDSQSLHKLLMQVSREDDAKVSEREAAIVKNRARAMQLLAVLEKSQS